MARSRISLRVFDVVNRYVDSPYKLGGRSRSEGYDCFSLVLAIGEDLGITVPDEFEGQTMNTYSDLWLSDQDEAKRVMFGLFEKLAEKISPSKAFVFDILVFEDENGENVGIHAGKDLVLSAFTDVGVKLANIKAFVVKGAYRWVLDMDT